MGYFGVKHRFTLVFIGFNAFFGGSRYIIAVYSGFTAVIIKKSGIPA